jgi:colicin import membrane protein
MSAVVYREPYQLPAGLLALAVHGVFFALLYFGFSWQTEPPVTMSVELWQSLPEIAPAPPAEAEKVVAPPEKVVEVIKPDIVVPDKKPEKKPEVKPPEKLPEKKPEVKPVAKPEAKKPAESKKVAIPQPSAAEQQAARDRAEQEAAIGRVVDEYTSKISSKIRRNIVEPPGVANDARAEFLVIVLPGGRVLPPRLLKSSGNAAYDDAVERAILRSEPLPLPADAGLFSRFRELKLGFKPVE